MPRQPAETDSGNAGLTGQPTAASPNAYPRWKAYLAVGLIVAVGGAAYANSFSGGYVLDDLTSICQNPTIRQLWPIWGPLRPPSHGETVSGRPLLNLSFAVNYALDKLEVRGYHAVNLAIHLLAAVTLLAILVQTFRCPSLHDRFGRSALSLSLTIALLWVVHPLQTESVTYIVQRAESLMGLFYLATLYCVIRGAESNRPGWWNFLAVLMYLAGMATKEVMVTAPLVVLLYDRQFLAGSFKEALRRRWALYLGLAAAWALLACLAIFTGLIHQKPQPVQASWWSYARTQPEVILYYLRLSLWPHPLCLDHNWPLAESWTQIAPSAVLVAGLAATTIWALVRRSAWGFLGAWFFLILAPTSSVLPLNDVAFEHRMYLSLASVATLVALSVYLVGRRLADRGRLGRRTVGAAVALVVAATITTFGILTFQRNRDYRSEFSIWRDNVAKVPTNVRAHVNLADALNRLGRYDEAVAYCQKALELDPDFAAAHYNLGVVLDAQGRFEEAARHFQRTLEIKPDVASVHNSLGSALNSLARREEAIAHFRKALALKPDLAEAYNNLADALNALGRHDEAVVHCQKALALKPDFALAHNNLGVALNALGRCGEAVVEYQEALRIAPDFAPAHNNLGMALNALGQFDEAVAQYQKALEIKPDFPATHNNLGNVLNTLGRRDEAILHYEKALEISPDFAEAHNNLGAVLDALGRLDEAVAQYQKALKIHPDFAEAHYNAGVALQGLGRTSEAVEHWRQAARLQPSQVVVLNRLAWALATWPDASVRNGAEAVQHAQRACLLTSNKNPAALDTLAAAYAEADRFSEAVETAQKALALAATQEDAALAEKLRERIKLYQSGKALRDTRAASVNMSPAPVSLPP